MSTTNALASSIDVEIRGLTLTGGDASQFGGAILSRERLLRRILVVTGNQATLGGAIALFGAGGQSSRRRDCTIVEQHGRARRAGRSIVQEAIAGNRSSISRQHDLRQHQANRGGALYAGQSPQGSTLIITGNAIARQFRHCSRAEQSIWLHLSARRRRSAAAHLRQHGRSAGRRAVRQWRPRPGDRRQHFGRQQEPGDELLAGSRRRYLCHEQRRRHHRQHDLRQHGACRRRHLQPERRTGDQLQHVSTTIIATAGDGGGILQRSDRLVHHRQHDLRQHGDGHTLAATAAAAACSTRRFAGTRRRSSIQISRATPRPNYGGGVYFRVRVTSNIGSIADRSPT